MHTATAVDGYWLAELGPMFFSVKVKALYNLAKFNHYSINLGKLNPVNCKPAP